MQGFFDFKLEFRGTAAWSKVEKNLTNAPNGIPQNSEDACERETPLSVKRNMYCICYGLNFFGLKLLKPV